MSFIKNRHFSTRLNSKVEHQTQKQTQKVMKSNKSVHLELNKDGQYVLPFSRRVIDINLPWLIKEQKTSSVIVHHGKCLNIEADVSPQEETMKEKDFFIVDKRFQNKFQNNSLQCQLDMNGDSYMSGTCPWRGRLYGEYYDDDDDNDDDDDDFVDEGQRLLDEHVVNFTKFLWSQHGKSIPEDFINPFEIYD